MIMNISSLSLFALSFAIGSISMLDAFSVHPASKSFQSRQSLGRHPFIQSGISHQQPSASATSSLSPQHSKTALHDFIADHYFMLNGIAAGVILSIGTSVNRNVQADQAWEERIKDSQVQRASATNNAEGLTELDLRAEIAENSPSMYGPEAIERRKRRRNANANARDNDDDEYDDEEEDELSPEEILEFEKMYGVKYDPYFDQAYFEDELPNNMEFSVDSYFGDRVYENGEVFFKDGDKYYRKGSKPRMKFFSWNKSN